MKQEPILLALLLAAPAFADGRITFSDIAADGGSGLAYNRVPSASNAAMDALVGSAPVTIDEVAATPAEPRGFPGTAIFDYDGDGDLDIYVTNGPGADNSLFSNQLRETGQLTFVDVAVEAGVAARDQDSTGVAYGDVDNDGDPDLLVLGGGEPNRLFENAGAGADGRVTFTDITEISGLGGGDLSHTSASFGDVDGDGLLDVVVAASFPHSGLRPIFFDPFALNHHNQLFLNAGGNVFVEAGEAAGLHDLGGLPPAAAGSAGISWAVALVDVDLDGDVDVMTADDQAGVPPAAAGGIDRGLLHLWRNDGTGHFEDTNVAARINVASAWMGLAYGDFNSDGHLDFFSSNLGDASFSIAVMQTVAGPYSSRWFLGQADGTFLDPGVGELVVTPFGWGCVARDFDNDGDTDILFQGGLNGGLLIDATNPGTLLLNDGQARFEYDAGAFGGSTHHLRRTVHGVAVGDLNDDGFVDTVSVSNFDIPPGVLMANPFTFGSVFDPFAHFLPTFFPTDDGLFLFNDAIQSFPNGSLSVEISSADNGNGWVAVSTLGTAGITTGGAVNRDGIGAVVTFTPDEGNPVMQPILGGSSHLSQNSLTAHFGLGDARRGTIEVLWPGGTRNRLYGARRSEKLVVPEIPCSIDAATSILAYERCVTGALGEILEAGILERWEVTRFYLSAIRAFVDER